VTLVAHAIASAPPAALGGDGLRGRPLAWSESGGLGLWSTEWESVLALGRADALEHHRVVERICAVQPCLPVRFGTSFATAEAARASLDARAAALREALDRVAGKSEVAVTLLWRAPLTPPATALEGGPGRRYMEERRARQSVGVARRKRAAEVLERLLVELSAERPLVWHETCTSENVAVSLAVLVPTGQAESQKARLERLCEDFADVVGLVNGPWPPYTFARLE
jgi:hypothetical protein